MLLFILGRFFLYFRMHRDQLPPTKPKTNCDTQLNPQSASLSNRSNKIKCIHAFHLSRYLSDHTLLITFSFFLGAPKLANTLQISRVLMAWVDQHKTHNSPRITSWIARKMELNIAMEEAKTVNGVGKNLAKNNQ
mmetsp:Transcript_6962/g.14340  ORF Transcript_6962/g.14340 Transcript_6962/m.14340 type:complete len:135 (-) Transcript_6962:403-807(-)